MDRGGALNTLADRGGVGGVGFPASGKHNAESCDYSRTAVVRGNSWSLVGRKDREGGGPDDATGCTGFIITGWIISKSAVTGGGGVLRVLERTRRVFPLLESKLVSSSTNTFPSLRLFARRILI